MNLLNLHLRISCIVLFAFFLGSGCLNYDNNWCPSNHFTWKSACCLQMMCFCIHHHYFFLMMVINIKDKRKSHMAETWITGSNQCIKFQTMVPCGEYSYTIFTHTVPLMSHPRYCISTSMGKTAFWSLYFLGLGVGLNECILLKHFTDWTQMSHPFKLLLIESICWNWFGERL